MADEKNQNDAVKDLLARLRSQMNQLDEAFGFGTDTASADEQPSNREETETVAEEETETVEESIEESVEEVVEEPIEETAEETVEELTEEPAEEIASEEIPAEEPEQLDIFAALETAEEGEPLPTAQEVCDEASAEEEIIEEADEEDTEAEDIPVFVPEEMTAPVRKERIVPKTADTAPAPVAEPVIVTVEEAPLEEENEEAEEDPSANMHASVFVPNVTATPPTPAADSIFSPERRFDPARFDAMLAAYEQQKAGSAPAPEAEKPQVHYEAPKRPILNPLPEVTAAPSSQKSAADIWSWDVEEESEEDPEEEAFVEEMIASLEAPPEPTDEQEPIFPPEPPEVPVAETPSEEAKPQAEPEVSDNPRILMADPALRDNERIARRAAASSNRVFLAPSAYRIGDDYVRSTRKSSHEEDEEEEDYMSELPAAIRGHLVGSPLGRPNRVKSVKDEETASETEKKQKAPRPTHFAEEVRKGEEATPEAFRDYLRVEIGQTRVRLLVIAILSFILLLLENIPFVSVLPSDFVEVQTAGVLNALLLLGVAATAWPRLSVGFMGIRIGRVLPESILLLEAALAFLYSVIFGIFRAPVSYFSFVPAIGICVLYSLRAFRLEVARRTMEKALSEEEKLVLAPLDKKKGAEELRVLAETFGEDAGGIYRVRRARAVDGVPRRLSTVCEDEGLNFALLLSVLGVGVACFLTVFFLSSSPALAAESALFGSFLVAPVVMMCGVHVFPVCRADSVAGEDGTVVGEATVYEATATRAVSFEDVMAAPASRVKLSGVRVYCDDPTTVFKYLTALYNHIGGPLCGRFSGMYTKKKSSSAMVIRLVDATKDGVSAAVDGAELVVGNGQHMLAYGIAPSYDASDERALAGGKNGVLYVAVNGMICIKFYIEHGISPDFAADVRQLNRVRIAAVLRTYDPNLNDKTLERSALRGMRVVTVSKKKDEYADHVTERASAGILCRGGTEKLLSLLLLCFRVRRVLRVGWVCKLVGAIIGGAGAVVLSVLGIAGVLPSAIPALYHLVLLGVYLLYAWIRVKLPDLSKGK